MPKTGDYFVTKTQGNLLNMLFAWLIRWFTAKKIPARRSWRTLGRNYRWQYATVNHAGICVGDDLIVEAVSKVKHSPVDSYPEAVWISPGFSSPQRQAAAAFAEAQVGHGYNWLGLIAVGLVQERFGRHLKELTRDWWVDKLGHGPRWFCSELVWAAYDSIGVDLLGPDVREADLVSPEDLLTPNIAFTSAV